MWAAVIDIDPVERATVEAKLPGFIDLATHRFRLQRERLVTGELAVELLRRSLSPDPVPQNVT